MTASINMTDMKQVSMEIAITMEVHAALSTTTKAKAEYIQTVLERAVQAITADRDFLRAENEAMREMAAQPVEGLLKSRMREIRERKEAVQAAVAKAVEAEAAIWREAIEQHSGIMAEKYTTSKAAAIRSRGVAG